MAEMSTTIPKNNFKRIRQILEKAAIITCYHYEDMTGAKNSAVTVDNVLEAGAKHDFSRVYLDDWGNLIVVVDGNLIYTAYASIETARRSMNAHAFEKHFGQAPAVTSNGPQT
jgi:hypothetical protein